ncbi:MAG TPA: hypothetical protein PLB00_14915, partial [Pseudomonadota bacterium]|jgi:hypothetical protein|nr:hypothetical protein [Pseudomonadota bacterium]
MSIRFRRFAAFSAVLLLHAAASAQPVPQGRLTANNGLPGDGLGRALDLDGDVAVVAARNGVFPYVWERTGGSWQQVTQLDPGESAGTVIYGYSVAVGGQIIAVGAPESPQAGPRRGSVHIFEKTGGNWTHTAKLTVDENQTDDFFGGSVDLSGNRVVIGAEGAHVGMGQVQGAAYVFVKGPSGWTLEDKLVGADSTTYDNFAQSVAIEGDRVVVGCIGADNGQGSGFFDAGAAYVFERNASDWQQTAKLVAPTPFQNERFGRRVALSGDTIAAGTPGALVSGMVRRGAVDVFERVGGVWQHRSRVVASDGVAEEGLGQQGLALTSERLYVGSSGHVVDGQGMGSVYGYRRDAGGQWVQNSRFEAHDGVPGQSFGTWIGASGSTVMVGASTHDASRGAVYLMFDGMIFKDGFEAIAP